MVLINLYSRIKSIQKDGKIPIYTQVESVGLAMFPREQVEVWHSTTEDHLLH